MSKADLASREWCNLVFEGRNKEYGAYRARANKGKFQLRAIIIVVIILVAVTAIVLAKSAVEAALAKNRAMEQDAVELQELKKDEPKKEETKKIEQPKEQQPKEVVKVKNSIQFTVPKIVEDDKVDHTKELKTQEEVTKNKFAIATQDFDQGVNSGGINIDDMKETQTAGNENVAAKAKEPEVVDNAIVEVPATYPGGEAALLAFVNKNVVYPPIAVEQELQGTVILRFRVEVDGSVGTVKVEKSLSRECDKAAMDVVRKLKRFVPAKQQGHPVPVWFRLPIRFRIQ